MFGAPGFADDPEGLAVLLGRHERITEWTRAAGLDLQVSASGLQTVDAMIDEWRDDESIAPALSNEVGLFLGDVLLHEVSGSHWHVWPNGHPVIRLKKGQEIDVTAQARTRASEGQPHLSATLEKARAAS